MAAGHRAAPWPARHGRACRGSSTSPSSTTARRADVDRAARARRRARVRRPSGRALLRDRQRDPGADRALARAPPRSSGSSSGSYDAAKAEDPGRARHLRQLPDDRVPRAAVPRLRLLQRLPRSRRTRSRPISRGCRTSPATGRWCWPRSASTAAATARTRRRASLDWQIRTAFARGLRRRVRLRLDRRVAPRRPRHRRLGLRPDRPRPAAEARAGRGARARSPRCRSRRTRAGRASRSSSAATTARARSATCLDGLRALDYPDFEVIVVDDGSTDATADDRRASTAFRLISTENRGLCAAPATPGWQAATGEIVAYIDDDAYPDPHWLTYLAHDVRARPTHAGVGGPNIAAARRRLRSPNASRTRPAARCTCCSPTARPSTSPAATWRSAATALAGDRRLRPAVPHGRRRRRRLLAAAGARAGRSASARPRWSGTTAATRCARTGGSSRATAGPRRCSSGSGRRSTTRPATSPGPGGSTAAADAGRSAGLAAHLPRHLGHRAVPVGLSAGAGLARRRCR